MNKSTSTTTTSSLFLSSHGLEGFEMFRVSPEMSEVLKNHQVEVTKASLHSTNQTNDENIPLSIHKNHNQQQQQPPQQPQHQQ